MPKKSLWFLVIGRLQNRCGDVFGFLIFFLNLFFWPTSELRDTCTCIHGYWNQTKLPIHKVWWLREASQIGQTFIPPCEKVV